MGKYNYELSHDQLAKVINKKATAEKMARQRIKDLKRKRVISIVMVIVIPFVLLTTYLVQQTKMKHQELQELLQPSTALQNQLIKLKDAQMNKKIDSLKILKDSIKILQIELNKKENRK